MVSWFRNCSRCNERVWDGDPHTCEVKLQVLSVPTLRVKRLHPDAKLPTRATDGSAGWDLYALEQVTVPKDQTRLVPTGVAVEIPTGFVGLLCMRSGFATKFCFSMANGVGVIDSDYRGPVKVPVRNGSWIEAVEFGDRIAQLVIVPCPTFELVEVDELSETGRGTGGFGSSGR